MKSGYNVDLWPLNGVVVGGGSGVGVVVVVVDGGGGGGGCPIPVQKWIHVGICIDFNGNCRPAAIFVASLTAESVNSGKAHQWAVDDWYTLACQLGFESSIGQASC